MQDQPPIVSVVVLNHNSFTTLEQCLSSIMRLHWPRLEVIVVDNASTDGSADLVQARYGNTVRVIRRSINSPTAGRNEGFQAATGEFICSLDNDILLLDPFVIDKGIEVFEQFRDVGALAFKIASVENPDQPLPEHWWYRQPMDFWKDRSFPTAFFCEGAVLFRSEAIRVTGGYDNEFFWGFESADLALRFVKEGVGILYCPDLTCCELRLRGIQTNRRLFINYLSLRNRLWIVWKHYPLWRGVIYAVGRVGVAGIRAVRYGWVDLFLRGVRDGIAAPQAVRAQRKPLDRQTWKRIRDIRRSPQTVYHLHSKQLAS